MNLIVEAALRKKYKDLLLNFDHVNLREDAWQYFQQHGNQDTKFKNIEEFLNNVIDCHKNWIEDMAEAYPHRKEYWDRVLKYCEK